MLNKIIKQIGGHPCFRICVVILIDPLAFEHKTMVILTLDCFIPFLSIDEIVLVGNA